MKKEMLICIIIVILIVVLNVITQNNTNKAMDEINSSLAVIRENITSKSEEDLSNDMKDIINEWEEKSDILSFYIEHNELEKVGMYLREIQSNIETEEHNMAIQSLDTCSFIIEHIKDRYKVSLKNIF